MTHICRQCARVVDVASLTEDEGDPSGPVRLECHRRSAAPRRDRVRRRNVRSTAARRSAAGRLTVRFRPTNSARSQVYERAGSSLARKGDPIAKVRAVSIAGENRAALRVDVVATNRLSPSLRRTQPPLHITEHAQLLARARRVRDRQDGDLDRIVRSRHIRSVPAGGLDGMLVPGRSRRHDERPSGRRRAARQRPRRRTPHGSVSSSRM